MVNKHYPAQFKADAVALYRPRSRRRTPSCAGGSVSAKKNATSCARPPGISPGRRAGEPLAVRRRPPRALRREAVVPGRRGGRSSFYYWRSTEAARAARNAADLMLAWQIKAVHTAFDGTYGAPRITAELRDAGQQVNHKRVARVMRRFGMQGLRLRRRC